MIDIAQDLAALDAALESRPTQGPWYATKPEPHGTSVRGPAGVSLAWCGCATTVGEEGCYSIGAVEAAANAKFIATCSPDRIRRLIKAVREQEKEIERLRTRVRNFEEAATSEGLRPEAKERKQSDLYLRWRAFYAEKVRSWMGLEELRAECGKLSTVDSPSPELLLIHAMHALEELQAEVERITCEPVGATTRVKP